MPSARRYLTESAAKKAIGGELLPQTVALRHDSLFIPCFNTLHYFDFQSRGRRQVVRLLWEDAGIAYEDVRYSFEEYPEYKKSRISEMNPIANIPVIELNGRILTQSYAILRHFARQSGKYDGETEEEKYWADAMCDIVIDWAHSLHRRLLLP
ncbi:hypothetical protein OEA41_001456 [Lepraria neglecta]|uniref:GST N-terminal domain-containing protein n=1 Tax=Lepraria neglecta TaxID=209136 RepID=A0AAE0DLH1_9LECA|nr:hypothetical protein OEA41_001456 [Lepraria neglecta]